MLGFPTRDVLPSARGLCGVRRKKVACDPIRWIVVALGSYTHRVWLLLGLRLKMMGKELEARVNVGSEKTNSLTWKSFGIHG